MTKPLENLHWTLLTTIILSGMLFQAEGQYFHTVPSDACAPRGSEVIFSCYTLYNLVGFEIAAAQEWKITPTSGDIITFTSDMMGSPPDGFSFEGNILPMNVLNATGIKVTATSNLNSAMFQCIAFVPNTQLRNSSSLAIATLQVAGEPGQFSCGLISCPPLYSPGVDTTCTVQWDAPSTLDCAPLTSYTITVTRRDNGEVVSHSSQSPSNSRMHDIIVPEPAMNYTVTIAAHNTVGPTNCVVEFTSPSEEKPQVFTLEVTVAADRTVTIVPTYMDITHRLFVAKYFVVLEDKEHNIHGSWTFLGSSSSLSLDISSLPQCMSYTVSVTASNTGGSATTNSTLSLDPLTTLEVSCVAVENGCYLEASCVPSQSWLISGCRLDFMITTGSVSQNVTQFSIYNTVAAVSCDGQTVSYTGTAYDSTLRSLGCIRDSTTKCPFPKNCTTLSMITNGIVQNSESSTSDIITNGTVATYSCADGYELVGEENRTCLVDGTWTGAEPHCRNVCLCRDACQDSISHVWFPLSITLLIYSLILTTVTVALALFSCKKIHLKGGHRAAVPSHSVKEEVTLKENLCYGPIAPPPHPLPTATQTVSEYEEIGASSPK